MKTILKAVAVAAVAAMTMTTALTAEARGPGSGGASGWHGGSVSHGSWGGRGWSGGGWGHRGGYWGGGYWGPYWGGLALGLGVGAIAYGAYGGYGYDGYYAYPAYGVAPTGDYLVDAPAQAPAAPVARSTGQPVPLASRAPDPIFYPKNGQSTAKTESDRQECNHWATTQAGAMNDSSIFQRATFACMEGRAYVVR